MGRRVMRNVHLRDADGHKHSFQAGDEVPDHLEQFITNPGAWLGEGHFGPEREAEDDNDIEINDELSSLTVRQLTKLAQDKNVQMPENAKKADLLQRLRDAGVTSIG